MSRTKKAKNLLENPRATEGELKEIAAEMRLVLVNNGSTLDNAVKEEYARLITRLEMKAAGLESPKESEKKQRPKYSDKKKNLRSPEIIYDNQGVQKDLGKKYLLPEFISNRAMQKDFVWLDYIGMQHALSTNKRVVLPDKTELIFTNGFPDNWIGDLLVQSVKQINFYKTLLEVSPTINVERVKALHEFYMNNFEHRPMHKGELFWTRTPPIKANRPQNSYGGEQKIMPSKVADYLVKIKGFVIFVSGVDSHALCSSGNTFDFVYTGDNHSKTSGRGIFIEDSIRRTVTENIHKYVSLGRR